MEYQKIENLLDDASNQSSKFKTTMLKSSLCDYSDAYILVKRKITITGAVDDAAARQADERDKGVFISTKSKFTPFD